MIQVKTAPFLWALKYIASLGGAELDVTSKLVNATSLKPTFVADSVGYYRALLTAGNPPSGPPNAEQDITCYQPIVPVAGKVTFIRVHPFDDLVGLPQDPIDAEVFFGLDSMPGIVYGFQLRNDRNRPGHQGMFDLLRQAYTSAITVSIKGSQNGTVSEIQV